MIQEAVFQSERDGKWYYWDETWSFIEGAWDTREECEKALHTYCETVLGVKFPDSYIFPKEEK